MSVKQYPWTAGEWIFDHIGAFRFLRAVRNGKEKTVASFPSAPGISPQERTANATICQSAPELYAALEGFAYLGFSIWRCDDEWRLIEPDHDDTREWVNLTAIAHEALKKARGEA